MNDIDICTELQKRYRRRIIRYGRAQELFMNPSEDMLCCIPAGSYWDYLIRSMCPNFSFPKKGFNTLIGAISITYIHVRIYALQKLREKFDAAIEQKQSETSFLVLYLYGGDCIIEEIELS